MIVEVVTIVATAAAIACDMAVRSIEKGSDWARVDVIVHDMAESLNETGLTDD